jgi:hypothetical protein
MGKADVDKMSKESLKAAIATAADSTLFKAGSALFDKAFTGELFGGAETWDAATVGLFKTSITDMLPTDKLMNLTDAAFEGGKSGGAKYGRVVRVVCAWLTQLLRTSVDVDILQWWTTPFVVRYLRYLLLRVVNPLHIGDPTQP